MRTMWSYDAFRGEPRPFMSAIATTFTIFTPHPWLALSFSSLPGGIS
jgi:hypothetical protein